MGRKRPVDIWRSIVDLPQVDFGFAPADLYFCAGGNDVLSCVTC